MRLAPTFLALAALAFCAGCDATAASPAQVILIRHAEKPPDGPELDARGWQRATALAKLFTTDARVLEHGPATAVFAMKPEKTGDSVRAIQTVEATAHALSVKIDRHYKRDEVDDLARAVRRAKGADGKTIIICWEHKKIPDILQALGWNDGPKKWGDDVYDRLWILDFENGKPVRFRDLPQKLLPGDATK